MEHGAEEGGKSIFFVFFRPILDIIIPIILDIKVVLMSRAVRK